MPLVSVLPSLEPRNVAKALDLLIPAAGQLHAHGLLEELTNEARFAATAGAVSAGLQLRAIKVERCYPCAIKLCEGGILPSAPCLPGGKLSGTILNMYSHPPPDSYRHVHLLCTSQLLTPLLLAEPPERSLALVKRLMALFTTHPEAGCRYRVVRAMTRVGCGGGPPESCDSN